MEKKKGISGSTLKMIAIVTMLIDHLGATLVWSYYLLLRQQFDPAASDWYDIYMWMRRIGRRGSLVTSSRKELLAP